MTPYDCILAIIEYKSVTKAAEHLFITQPALTLKIKRLENSLGVVLFEPGNRTVLTPEGELYVREMGQIIAETNILHEKLQAMSEHKQKESICIAIGFNRGKAWLPVLLPFLQQCNPDVSFQVQEATDGDIEDLVRSDRIDIGVMSSAIISSSVSALPLGEEFLYLAIPQDSPLLTDAVEKGGCFPVIEPTALNGQTLILGNSSFGNTRQMRSMLEHFGIRLKSSLNIGNIDTAYLLAAAGLGIAPTFASCQDTPLPSPAMRRPVLCQIKDYPLSRQVSMVCKASRQNDPLIQALWQQTKEFWVHTQ